MTDSTRHRGPTTTAAATHRGVNFFAVAVLALLAIPDVLELAALQDPLTGLLDLVFVASSVAAVVWYRIGEHRYSPSLVPASLVAVALATRVASLAALGVFTGPAAGHTMFLTLVLAIHAGHRLALRRELRA